MEANRSLTVDIADPADVRSKLPQARRIARAFRHDAAQAAELAAHWERLVHVLEGVAGPQQGLGSPDAPETTTEVQSADRPSSVEVVVAILDQQGVPMRIGDVHRLAPNFERKTIQWALWKAKGEGKIHNPARGEYAPLSYRMTEITPRLNGGSPGEATEE